MWLLTGIALLSVKIGGFVSLATGQLDLLREEAARSHELSTRPQGKYREVTEHATGIISEIDETGRFLYANCPLHLPKCNGIVRWLDLGPNPGGRNG